MDTNSVKDFLTITYGSKLFGTSTPTSDTDVKVIFLPSYDSLLLGYAPKVQKIKLDADGNKVDDDATMPENGVETEYIPLQKFARDFVQGQTYAVEIAFGYITQEFVDPRAYIFVRELIEKFTNADVLSMTGFADKQTFDYVRRGERLTTAQNILKAIDRLIGCDPSGNMRLDTRLKSGEHAGKFVLDVLSAETSLPIGESVNTNKTLRTLEMNSRQYLESTTLAHIRTLILKQIAAYGDRTKEAAKKDVDYKSLSHAVRVYQQAIELLDTGMITFPRPNAAALLAIKKGQVSIETVRGILSDLEDEVNRKFETTKLRKRTEELDDALEFWLLAQLHDIYGR